MTAKYKIPSKYKYITKRKYLHQIIRKRIIQSSTIFVSLFLYVKSLGFTDSLKIANVSGLKSMNISSSFLYQLSNTSSRTYDRTLV